MRPHKTGAAAEAVAAERAADVLRLLMKLRRSGITDTRVLAAIERVPRERFVPDSFRDQAYEDTALPIALGQTISQPSVVAFMTQALEVGERMRVLEVGTGSGYQAAILAHLCRRLHSIERLKPLLDEAEKRFTELKLTNITTHLGDGSKGWKPAAPFDRIIVTAGATLMPEALIEQLAPEGILILPLGDTQATQELYRIAKDKDGNVTQRPLLAVRFVPLVGS